MTDAPATAVDIFTARCEARALLCEAGELTWQDAVDGCQRHAEAYGLVAQLGQNAVQAIIADAFRDDVVPSLMEKTERTDVAESTLQAAGYLWQQNDVQRWNAWLAKHSDAECTAIIKRIKQRRRR